MENNVATEKPKRRWYQFSLRTMLVFVALLALGLGWLGAKLQKERSYRQAVQAIERLGRRVVPAKRVGRNVLVRLINGPTDKHIAYLQQVSEGHESLTLLLPFTT